MNEGKDRRSQDPDLVNSGAFNLSALFANAKKLEEEGKVREGVTGTKRTKRPPEFIEDHDLLGNAELETDSYDRQIEKLIEHLEEGGIWPSEFRGALRGVYDNVFHSDLDTEKKEQKQAAITALIEDLQMQVDAFRSRMNENLDLKEAPRVINELTRLRALAEEDAERHKAVIAEIDTDLEGLQELVRAFLPDDAEGDAGEDPEAKEFFEDLTDEED